MEWITSIKGKTKLCYEGYIYVKQNNLANGVVAYECEMRKRDTLTSNQCKAKVKVANDEIVGFVNEHTHAPV